MMLRRLFVGVIASLALASPAAAAAAAAATPSSEPPGLQGWWRIFGDPALERLMAQADRDSPTIEAAQARLARAQAFVRGARAQALPQLALTASPTSQSGPLINAAGGEGRLYSAGANLSYSPDVFRRLAKADRAGRLDVASHSALVASARLIAEAQVARTYFQIRAADAERAQLTAAGEAWAESVRILMGRRQSGLEADAALDRASAEQGAVEADGLAVDRRRAELEHQLAFLIGMPAEEFRLEPAPLREGPPPIPGALPSELLQRRPDLMAANLEVQAAHTRVDVARLAWLPSFNLTASGGFASPDLVNLLATSARSFGLGMLFALPIFDGGKHAADVGVARADARLAEAERRGLALAAFRDVASQLSDLQLLARQGETLRATLDADAHASALAESRFRDGLVSRLEVLDARRTELRDRRAAEQVLAERYAATVGLAEALGGGWGE